MYYSWASAGLGNTGGLVHWLHWDLKALHDQSLTPVLSEVSEYPELQCPGSPEKLGFWLKRSLRLVWVWVLNSEVSVATARPGVYATVNLEPQIVPRLQWICYLLSWPQWIHRIQAMMEVLSPPGCVGSSCANPPLILLPHSYDRLP